MFTLLFPVYTPVFDKYKLKTTQKSYSSLYLVSQYLLWLASRFSSRDSCSHWLGFWEVAESRVYNAGIKDVMLVLIHVVMLGLRMSHYRYECYLLSEWVAQIVYNSQKEGCCCDLLLYCFAALLRSAFCLLLAINYFCSAIQTCLGFRKL